MAETSLSPSPHHTIFLLLIVVGILVLPSFLPEASEPLLPSSIQDINPAVMLAPVLLILLVRFLSSSQWTGLGVDADAASIHRVSGSSVGLAVVLFIVVIMIWYRSTVQEPWYPGGVSE